MSDGKREKLQNFKIAFSTKSPNVPLRTGTTCRSFISTARNSFHFMQTHGLSNRLSVAVQWFFAALPRMRATLRK